MPETMEALGIARRTVHDWGKQGLLHWKVQIGEGKRERVYDARDVEKLRRDGPPPRTANRPVRQPGAQAMTQQQLARRPAAGVPPEFFSELVNFMRELAAHQNRLRQLAMPEAQNQKPAVPVHQKLWLSPAEARALSGLSRNDLRALVRDDSLVYRGAGRGLRILRKSLEAFEG
jgi:hypothetical protein